MGTIQVYLFLPTCVKLFDLIKLESRKRVLGSARYFVTPLLKYRRKKSYVRMRSLTSDKTM